MCWNENGNQPSRDSLRERILWKSSSGWLDDIFHSGTEPREGSKKAPCMKRRPLPRWWVVDMKKDPSPIGVVSYSTRWSLLFIFWYLYGSSIQINNSPSKQQRNIVQLCTTLLGTPTYNWPSSNSARAEVFLPFLDELDQNLLNLALLLLVYLHRGHMACLPPSTGRHTPVLEMCFLLDSN